VVSKIDKIICNYIAVHWIKPSPSNRSFAINHNIDEKTVRKILYTDGYRIPVKTLNEICESRELKLSQFFELINQ
jgi:DNA-binding Xre family transcriptional regulator